MDQIRWLFALPNKNKPFYVNNRFSRIYIHEYIHFMQRYLKPIDKTVHKSIQSHCPDNPEILKTIQNDIINADKNLVYTSEKGKNFTPENFRQELMDLLYSPEYSSDLLVKDELKFLIRHTQSEKQAYEIEMEEAAWLSQPNLMKNKQYRKFRRQIARKALEKNFRFEDKLRIMKEEYFKLLKQEREKLKQN